MENEKIGKENMVVEEVIKQVIEDELERYHGITQREGQVMGLGTLKTLMEDQHLYRRIAYRLSKISDLIVTDIPSIAFSHAQLAKEARASEDLPGTADALEVEPSKEDISIEAALGILKEKGYLIGRFLRSKMDFEQKTEPGMEKMVIKASETDTPEEIHIGYEEGENPLQAVIKPGKVIPLMEGMVVEDKPTPPETYAQMREWEGLNWEMSTTQIQKQIDEWSSHNFPTETALTNLLGVVEEVGELAHAELKGTMGIRGGTDDLECRDAVGDILIFLMSYCNQKGYNMKVALLQTWKEVRQRDWRIYPKNGKTE